jgi:mono/diheme cytochrome c family protein
MQNAKIVSFTSCLILTVALCVLGFGFHASPGMAADELQREWVPGLDLWSQKRKAAPYWDSKEATPALLARAARHREFLAAGVPVEYRSRNNPYPAATMVIEGGAKVYTAYCAACHGAKGLGDGDAGRDLTPSPALLAHLIDRRRSVDEYLLWTISEGGAQFATEMPAYKDLLTDQEIWQIVTYMRAGFPNAGAAGQD